MKIESITKKCQGGEYGLNPTCQLNAEYRVEIRKGEPKIHLCSRCLNTFKQLNRETQKSGFFPTKTSSIVSPNITTGIKSFSGFGKKDKDKKSDKKEIEKTFADVLYQLTDPKPPEIIITGLGSIKCQRIEVRENLFYVYVNGKPLYKQNRDYKNIGYF